SCLSYGPKTASIPHGSESCRGTKQGRRMPSRFTSPSNGPGTGPFSFPYRNNPSMAITKEKKQEVVAKVADALSNAVSVVFVHFKGLSVADTSAMRKQLRGEGIGYYVAKKSLIRRALADKGYEGELPNLEGEIALAWSAE